MKISIEKYLMNVAMAVAERSSCRRKVGCVLADAKGRILSTGYNGPPSGIRHCDERECNADSCDGGCDKSCIPGKCDAVHAEINAIIQCNNIIAVRYVAVTISPCLPCMKALMNTSARVLVFRSKSSHLDALDYWALVDGNVLVEV